MKDVNRIIWIDYARALACIFVVLLHVSAYYITSYNEVSPFNWNVANLIDSLTRSCVPIFFMISGYFFFSNKKPSVKNILRVVLSLLFYSAIAFVLYMVTKKASLEEAIDNISFFSEPSFYHLWFFYPLISIYLISYLCTIKPVDNLRFLFVILILVTLLNPRFNDITEFLFGISIKNNFMITGDFFYFLLYAITGGIFKNINENNLISEKHSTALAFVAIASWISIYLLTNNLYYKGMQDIYSFYDYASPFVFSMSLSTFLFFISIKRKLKPCLAINFISKNSLAIFGIHAFILAFFKKFIDYRFTNSIIAIPLIFVTVFFLSLLFSFFLRKIDKKHYIS